MQKHALIMKNLLIICCFIFVSLLSSAQTSDTTKYSIVTKTDGKQFRGVIKLQDIREVIIETKQLGLVAIPKHEIEEIKACSAEEVDEKSELFSTRYFITTNGFPLRKKETYVQFSLYGVDFQTAITNNINVGIMTSWVAIPIIGTVKYSKKVRSNLHVGGGLLLGTGSWAAPQFSMALPFGVATLGDRANNVTLSLGYGAIRNRYEQYNYTIGTYTNEYRSSGKLILSVSGSAKLTEKASFVFDSFILPNASTSSTPVYDVNGVQTGETIKTNNFILLIPGIRFQTSYSKAFQFGFAGISTTGKFAPIPIPMVQWFRKI